METTPSERPFDFSEMYIFGKFDTFTRRLKKILEMFDTIDKYSHLSESKIEGSNYVSELLSFFFLHSMTHIIYNFVFMYC